MKIVIAPDSFKGSLSASQLCRIISQSIHKIDSNIELISIPLADGGEGTMENMVHSTGGKEIRCNVLDPLNRPIPAKFGVLGNEETAMIEMAQASGLPLLLDSERNPLITTSYGTGQLIKHALDMGYRRFIIGLGGSATNDAGIGMLRALGMKFFNQHHKPIHDGGGSLAELAYIDDSGFDYRIKESTFLVASDVENPLCGENGASAVFGPQKGADYQMVKTLDENLHHFADIILKQKGIDILSIAGGGAAGGMGAALVTFMNATIGSGIETVMKEVHFAEKILNADLIITGEGKLDHQTLSGKVIKGVCRQAGLKGIPVIALCGQLDLKPYSIQELGLLAAFSIINKPCSLETAFSQSEEWVGDVIEHILRVFLYRNT